MRCSRLCSRVFMNDIGQNWSSLNDGSRMKIWFGWKKHWLSPLQRVSNYFSTQAGQMTENLHLHTKISALELKFNSEHLSKKGIIPTTTSSTNSPLAPVHSTQNSIPTTTESQIRSTFSFAVKKSSQEVNESTTAQSSSKECTISAFHHT